MLLPTHAVVLSLRWLEVCCCFCLCRSVGLRRFFIALVRRPPDPPWSTTVCRQHTSCVSCCQALLVYSFSLRSLPPLVGPSISLTGSPPLVPVCPTAQSCCGLFVDVNVVATGAPSHAQSSRMTLEATGVFLSPMRPYLLCVYDSCGFCCRFPHAPSFSCAFLVPFGAAAGRPDVCP